MYCVEYLVSDVSTKLHMEAMTGISLGIKNIQNMNKNNTIINSNALW